MNEILRARHPAANGDDERKNEEEGSEAAALRSARAAAAGVGGLGADEEADRAVPNVAAFELGWAATGGAAGLRAVGARVTGDAGSRLAIVLVGARVAESPADVEHAKTLCRDCPVRELCLDGALERREPWGVWGGELFLQGVVIPRKRPRGRPRKDDPYNQHSAA